MLNIKERLKSIKWSKKKVLAIAAVLIIVAGSIYYYNSSKAKKAAAADVLTVPVDRGTIQQTIEGTGVLQPSERFVLKTKTNGTVEAVMVTEGTLVKKGDPILSINNEKVDTQSRQAALSWQLAQNDLNELLNPTAKSTAARIAAELKVEQYQIALEAAQEQKDNLVLKAPFDGKVLENKLTVGQRVNAGTTALTVATTDQVEVVGQFAESDLSSIAVGMKASVFVKGLNTSYNGTVKEIAFSGDHSTGTFEVILSLTDPDNNIRPGMQTYNTVIIANDPDNEIYLYKQGQGYIRYTEEEDMVTEVSGTVAEIFLKPGTKIYKGEPILRLTNPELDRKLREAELQLANAQEDLNRLINPDDDTIKQQELKVLQSYDSYLTVKEKADSLYVTSPIEGVVVKLSVSPGEELSSENLEQEMVVVSSFQQTKLEISVDELDINKVKMGQEAVVTVDALPEARLKGVISGIAYEGTATNGITKYNVTLSVDYTEGIKGGMSATATISLDKKENVLRVPAEAVTKTNNRSTVKVQVNGQTQTKVIETGLTTARWIEVTKGLQEGDQVVVATSAASGPGQFFGPGIGGAPGGNTQRTNTQRSTTQNR